MKGRIDPDTGEKQGGKSWGRPKYRQGRKPGKKYSKGGKNPLLKKTAT